MPHGGPHEAARSSTRVAREREGQSQEIPSVDPGSVRRRSAFEAFQDDVRQTLEGNPIFEALDFVAQNAGPFLGAEPGGAMGAPFRFLAARQSKINKLRQLAPPGQKVDDAFNEALESLGDFEPSPQSNITFKILDPADQGRGGAIGTANISRKVPVTAEEGKVIFEELPSGAEALKINTIGELMPDAPIGGPGTRGNIEAIIDALRQRPGLARVTSTSRGTGSREPLLDALENRAFGREAPLDQVENLLNRRRQLKIVNQKIPERLRTRAENARLREGTRPILDALREGNF